MDKIVIVYQPGKVGSTALTSTLNSVPGVEAYQCHFLGENTYNALIKSFLNGSQSDYSFEHGMGQVARNVKAERVMLRHERAGGDSYIFSASREPISWFSSALTQDLRGTIDSITALASFMSQEDKPIACLASLLHKETKRILSKDLPERFCNIDLSHPEKEYAQHAGFMREQIAVFFRPVFWFDEHFKAYTEKQVTLNDDMVFLDSSGTRRYLVMRYEDFSQLESNFYKYLDIPLPEITWENISAAKAGADDVNREIGKWESDKEFIQLLSGTRYCRAFRYHQDLSLV